LLDTRLNARRPRCLALVALRLAGRRLGLASRRVARRLKTPLLLLLLLLARLPAEPMGG